ncbi:TIM barrel protein [Loktanella sp. Alg231-35]|uniref:TIM barrel protein n=1 Tax=Loktanella sp. Alg231-35 TaxID=1922220 RepID=UPI00131F20EE|nr:TIM barrel protein [Loktanella sp. Alg231-35]
MAEPSMLPIAINHMTAPGLTARQLIGAAAQLDCVGVELRNDLGRALFEDENASSIGRAAAANGQRILALAEVKAFNENPADKQEAVEALVLTAAACSAEGVVLIPRVADDVMPRSAQRDALREALAVLQPILEEYGKKGLIEPLGFWNSSLRFKEDVVAVLDDLGRPECFAIIHDTFHHFLTGADEICAELTAIVHISGVADPAPSPSEMTDAHRVLVDADDRLGNIDQLRALYGAGYEGPASFEAFAPKIHQMTDPTEALSQSLAFITSQLLGAPAGRA